MRISSPVLGVETAQGTDPQVRAEGGMKASPPSQLSQWRQLLLWVQVQDSLGQLIFFPGASVAPAAYIRITCLEAGPTPGLQAGVCVVTRTRR